MSRSSARAAVTSPRKEGFADVARWIALDPDGETAIYRKFGELRARSLLYQQCRLAALEKRLGKFDEQDAADDDIGVRDAARTWETLEQRYAAGNEAALARMQLLGEIDMALKEYCIRLTLTTVESRLVLIRL